MSAAAVLAGWALAALAGGLLLAARRRDAARRERVARACHELRGPLHAAGLALHGAHGPGAAARIDAAQEELRRAVLALGDLDGAPTGRTPRERRCRVDIGALVARHAAAWRAVAGDHGAALRILLPDRPAVVLGDPLRLAQAAANLVANAAEHGGGSVELRVRGAEAGRVQVEVADDGPGLAALPRAPRTGRGRRGRGLAIAGEVAARHGGRLSAAPAPGGARLVLDLPGAAPAERS